MYLPVHSIHYWISTIAKNPSTEQHGGIDVMFMGRNGGYSLQDDDLYARVCKSGDVAYIRVDDSLESGLPPSVGPRAGR